MRIEGPEAAEWGTHVMTLAELEAYVSEREGQVSNRDDG
jgi:hypothetical protein